MEETTAQRGSDRRPQVRRTRADGWTEARQRIFFAHLGATCNVRFAAGQAGMNYTNIYRRRVTDPVFRERWRLALEDGYVRIETMLLARAGGTGDTAALIRAAAAEAAGDATDLSELTESLDSGLALQLIAAHRKALHGGPRRGGGPEPTKADPDELAESILKRLAAINKRSAMEQQSATDRRLALEDRSAFDNGRGGRG